MYSQNPSRFNQKQITDGKDEANKNMDITDRCSQTIRLPHKSTLTRPVRDRENGKSTPNTIIQTRENGKSQLTRAVQNFNIEKTSNPPNTTTYQSQNQHVFNARLLNR
ncbi:hypothetical protein DERF_002712 [Dermatophagoides farinae]|uniref:Uncharacterized protein n=1 Tax=Dermatophagoides farinae TaxID=6954 RepID=A0A922IGN3_DERFA|nr:hypothetical protein DERF_002712 [Dermatophagoides farinae]